MTATTALRMVDIHNRAARLLPKPMLPNIAKAIRTSNRTPKRISTWADPSFRGKSGNCIALVIPGAGAAIPSRAYAKLSL